VEAAHSAVGAEIPQQEFSRESAKKKRFGPTITTIPVGDASCERLQ